MDWRNDATKIITAVKRVRFAYGLVIAVVVIFLIRLFYVQVIDYGHYHNAALSDQMKQYQIPATRGIIYAEQGGTTVPIVLNTELYTIYADPSYVKNPNKVAGSLASVLGGKASDYVPALTKKNTQYVVIEKRVSARDEQKLLAYKYPGLGAQAQDYRTYPNGDMAAQLLGFVDSNGQGQYGIEQALNKQLAGSPGRVKAITDIHGVPLAADPGNVSTQPKAGDNVTLTIDTAMQKQLETILKQGDISGKGQGASALILNADTGAVKAMANYPTYNPAEYYNVASPGLFQNGTVDHAIEMGSIMKTLTASAALNQGVIQPNTSFYDPGHWTIDGFTIGDVDPSQGTQTIGTVLNLSLNTGATWMLMQMGGGQLDQQGRNIWHNYMTQHFRLGQKTGITQGYEDPGFVPSPENNGAGINLTYANTSFGQGVTATPLQMAAALASVVNGGTYYKPRLISQITTPDGRLIENNGPQVVEKNVVKSSTSQGLIGLLQYVVENHTDIVPQFDQSKFIVGGKTGTAQVADPSGGYYPDRYNATFIGFVKGANTTYVIIVYVYNPDTTGYAPGFAGAYVAMPIFTKLGHMLINNGYVAPND